MSRAAPAAWLLAATAITGLLFTPVFGLAALLLPVGLPVAVLFLGALACGRHPSLPAWRPVLLAAAGVLAAAEATLWSTTAAGVPTGRTLRALSTGVTDSWLLTLQSTWPARPDPELLLFVPLLVVLAGVLGIELLHRLPGRLPALAPSLAVAVLSQLYAPLTAVPATVAALAYAAAAGALLMAAPVPAGSWRHRLASATRQLAPSAACVVVAALLAGLVLPAGPVRYSLRPDRAAPVAQAAQASPLDEIAYRLAHPGVTAFRVRGAAGVDRWPLVVLDSFDGVNWTSGDRYRRLGTGLLPDPAVTVPVQRRSARIEVSGVDGPWLPSQTWPAGVDGIAPLIEPQHGTLLLPGAGGPVTYTLSWWQPEIDAAALGAAAVDPRLAGGLGGVGGVPAGMTELADQAVHGMGPSFQAALALERFLREQYRLVAGTDLPTGHGWPQLAHFLLGGLRGTSEQFAAAYVALARLRNIPARLVVGFRVPAGQDPERDYTITNGDILAWPEVAVAGAGWVPLDPGGSGPAPGAPAGRGLAAATAQARAQLPPPGELRNKPPVARPKQADPPGFGFAVPRAVVAAAGAGLLAVVLLGWLAGVPVAKTTRAWRRRRRPGPAAVAGAWAEARDRLRDHGVAVTTAMTVRDLAAAAAPIAGQSAVDGLHRLRATVDRALWSATSGDRADRADRDEAWAAVRAVRRGLARRGWRARLRAGLDPRSLLPR
jgi:transglutaminase-like putative cysteine protease